MTKTVLITGAAIGIGRATSKAFAKVGYHVIATDVLENEGNAVVVEIAADNGSAEFHKLDVRSTADAEALVAGVEKKHGAIDCIVANAGIDSGDGWVIGAGRTVGTLKQRDFDRGGFFAERSLDVVERG